MASLETVFYLILISLPLTTIFFSKTVVSQTDATISTDPSFYYDLCAPKKCNQLSVRYPFSPLRFCHHQDIVPTCVNNSYLLLASIRPSDTFRVVSNITSDATSDSFFVASNSLFSCGSVDQPNYTVDPNIFSLSNNYTYGTHLNCTRQLTTTDTVQPASCIGCDGNRSRNFCYYVPGFASFAGCDRFYIFPPEGLNVSAVTDLRAFLQKGHLIRYTKPLECQICESSGGRCGTSPDENFVCFCPSSVHPINCSDGVPVDISAWLPAGGGSGISKKIIAAISGSAAAIALISVAILASIFIYRRRNPKRKDDGENGPDANDGTETDFQDLVGGMAPKKYSYSQIMKFTGQFSTKLGEGGFGSVYKGIIMQGSGHQVPVAVKVLKKLKQSEKQFMNEVATVGRIHHHNLVRLLGYCVHGKTQALIYEFVEKGSLDKYIYRANHQPEEEEEGGELWLSPKQVHRIAIETARGILYLHQGCRSRILHCDIKPHNVLLDSNYTAKVADFGLARMIDKDRSHVSLTVAQGTPGYAPPEMWSKSYGPITEKSDVYSYGMLLLEMASGRKNYDTGASASSQVYFPEWVFQQVERGELKAERQTVEVSIEAVGDEMIEEDDVEVLRKMCLVGLWCIQHIPAKRPSMSKVIQMLEGNSGIETPPQPFPEEIGLDLFPEGGGGKPSTGNLSVPFKTNRLTNKTPSE